MALCNNRTIVMELKCIGNKSDYEHFLLMIQFSKRVESSDMMEEEAMYWNVQLVVSIENCPFVKGTSDEEEIREVLDRVTLLVSEKE